MKRLIVNADDFGLHREINHGIIKGFEEGFITSTSIMTGAAAFDEAVALALEHPNLGVGVHLTLAGDVPTVLPLDKVPSLLGGNGLLLPNYLAFAARFYSGFIKKEEIASELSAQIEKALAAGLNITHLDSHQHLHVLPGITSIVLALAERYQINKIRIPKENYFFNGGFQAAVARKLGRAGLSCCATRAATAALSSNVKFPDNFYGMLAGGHLNSEHVAAILKALPEGTSELMTHPGLNAEALAKCFPWHYHWEDELAAFLDDSNKKLITQLKVDLISYAAL